MRLIIFIILSLITFVISMYYKYYYIKPSEYYSSLYIINESNEVSHIKISTNIKNNEFISQTYVRSAGINDIAVFSSKGEIKEGNIRGEYILSYSMNEVNPVSVVDIDKAELFIRLKARTAFSHNENIKLLYSDNGIHIFDMQRNNNTIMYSSNK